MKIPNFDDVDLGIISITIITITVALTLQGSEGLGFAATGITAIATLAGRKKNNGDNKKNENNS